MATSWTTRTEPSTSWTSARETLLNTRITQDSDTRVTQDGLANRITQLTGDLTASWTARTEPSTSWTNRVKP